MKRLLAVASILGLACGVCASPAQAFLLSSAYQLEETSGPVLDAVGGNDGSVIGSPTRGVPGVVGNAYRFDGSNDAINLGTASSVKPTGPFSITMWFDADNLASLASYARLADASGPDGSIQWGYRLQLPKQSNTEREIRGIVMAGPPKTRYDVFMDLPDPDGLHFVGLVFDPDNDQFRLRVDDTTQIKSLAAGDNNVIYNAADVFIAKAATANRFDGLIDEIGFWGEALTDGELSAIRAGGLFVPEPATLAVWSGLLALGCLAWRRTRQ